MKSLLLFLFLFQLSFAQTDSISYYYQKEDLNKAIDYAIIKIDKLELENLQFTSECAITYQNLGVIYKEAKKFKLAENCFKSEIKILTKVLGENNSLVGTSYWNLANIYFDLKDYENAEKNYLKAIAIKYVTVGENDRDYLKYLIDLAILYTDINDYENAEALFTKVLKLRKINQGENNIGYQKVLLSFAISYEKKGDIKKSEELFLQSYSLQKRNLNKETVFDFLFSVDIIGKTYNNQQKYSEAQKFYLESAELKKKILGAQSQEYINSLIDLGMSFSMQSDYRKSRKYYEEVNTILKKSKNENSPDIAFVLSALASGYRFEGKYDLSEKLYYQALNIYNINYGENSKESIRSLKLLAGNYLDKGDLNNAERYHLKFINQIIDKNSTEYLEGLIDVGNFYLEIKNPTQTYKYLSDSNQLYSKLLTNIRKDDLIHYFLQRCWQNYYIEVKDYKKALDMALSKIELTKSNPLFKSLSGSYSRDLSDIALVYKYIGDYKNSEKFYLQAYGIKINSIGQNPRSDASLLLSIALIYQRNNDFINAEKYFILAIEMVEESLNTNLPFYTNLLYFTSTFFYDNSNHSKSLPYLKKIFTKNNLDINHTISFLSVKEFENIRKQHDSKRNFPLSFLHKYYSHYPEITIGCYESELILKNLSLRHQKRIKSGIEKSGDVSLQKKYQHFIENKRYLIKLEELTIEKRPTTYEQLVTTTETLEKELVRQSSTFANAKKSLSITWNQVQERLKPNEMAIELVSYNYYNKKWTDSIVYAAFVVKKGFKAPKYIALFEQKQLEFLLAKNTKEKDNERIDKQYTNKALSNLFLQPLQNELKGVKSIYLSPSGLGHQIDFSALSVSETQTLGEKYQVHILGSTAEIVNYKIAHLDKKSNFELLLYGDIDYDKSEVTMKVATDILENNSDATELTKLATRSGITKWNYLAGTKREVQQIRNNSEQNGFSSTIIKDRQATEESIKELDGRTTPFVLHLATHGFFFPDPKKELPQQNMLFDNKSNIFKIADDPMMRSGLLFAGANTYWGKPTENVISDDGILTASEISNLDLTACQLVVLSACETGLGEINGSEGVFGLQRAFKMAGVKNIIMSLWKVPDVQTAELFDVFYTECFAGKTIHEAFQTAQAAMKAKYSPYYWAGFVLLE